MNREQALARFNEGCALRAAAIDALEDRDFAQFEKRLISAGGATIGALEWAIKIYLRQDCRSKLTNGDYERLHRPNFHTLVELLGLYADPKLDDAKLASFEEYRSAIRNPGEHDASIPSIEYLEEAIGSVRAFLIDYLNAQPSSLESSSISKLGKSMKELREEYFGTLRDRYEYLDLGGVSPRVGNKIVRIKMEDIFVPLRAIESVSLLETFADDLGRTDKNRQPATGRSSDGVWDDEEFVGGILADGGVSSEATKPTELQRLLEEPRLVVLGDPGSGKTTVGRHIAYCIASGQADSATIMSQFIPILLRASEFGAVLSKDPSRSLYGFTTDNGRTKFGQLFSIAIQTGRALVIIDGLDEVADLATRALTSRRIEEFVSEFRDNHYLVTSRLIGYRQNQISGNFQEVQIAPFDSEQILAFLTKWHQAVDQQSRGGEDDEEAVRRAQELWSAIRESPGTSRLATNPLLITIVALTSWRGTKLPNRRVELYQIATETLLENWPLRQRGQNLQAREIMSILEPVAFEIIQSGNLNAIPEFDLRPLVEQKVCELQGVPQKEAKALSREMLGKIEEHTGFFVERGLDPSGRRVFGFLHLTFAEYLAGRYLAEQWSVSADILSQYAHDPRWSEVVLLMAGHVGTWSVAQISKLVTDTLRLDSSFEAYIHRDLLLAASMLADNARVTRQVQDLVVNQLIDVILADLTSGMTGYARYLLKRIGELSPLGSPLSRIEPSADDVPEVRLRKAALCLTVGHDGDRAAQIVFDGLFNDSKSDPLSYDAAFALLGNGSIDRADAVAGIFLGGMQFAQSITPSVTERLKKLPGVVFSLKELGNGPKSGLVVVTTEELLRSGAEKVADAIISNEDEELGLLMFALTMSQLHFEVREELLARGLVETPRPWELGQQYSGKPVSFSARKRFRKAMFQASRAHSEN